MAAWMVPGGAVRADATDTLNLRFGIGTQYDSNLFRVADGFDLASRVGRSARDDRITTANIGLDFRKAWSLQQFEASVEKVRQRHATHDFLDHDLDNLQAAWRWSLSPRLTGNLVHQRTQSLIGFDNYTDYTAPNLRTVNAQRFDADWHVTGGWHLRAGADRERTDNSRTFTQDDSVRSTGLFAGIRYIFPSGSRLEATTRRSDGEYDRALNIPAQLDNDFRQTRRELRARWALSGKSTLEGGIGRVAREHAHFAARDFSGTVGNLQWNWQATGKLGLAASLKRDLAAFHDANASYYVSEAISLTPAWQIGAKFRLSLSLNREWRRYHGAIVPPPTARREHTDSARLSAAWQPRRNIALSAYLGGQRRDASLPALDYTARSAGADLRIDF